MRRLIPLFALSLFTWNLYAITGEPGRPVIEVGQDVPNMCWQDENDQQVCLEQHSTDVRVLVYSTGWCPGCNSEWDELAPRVKEFDGQSVTFYSLSAQSDNHGEDPNAEFLKSWRQRHNIPASVVVAAAPKDAGKSFFTPPLYIPSAVVIGKDGKLLFKAVAPDVDTLFGEIKKGLAR